MPLVDSDEILKFLVLVVVAMCAPVVIMSIIGVLISMRRGIVPKAVGGILGFVIGVMTTVGMVNLVFWSLQSRNPVVDAQTMGGFIVLFVGCCTVGIVVTVALIYLIGRIRRMLMLRTGAGT